MDPDSQTFTARPAAYALESSDGESDWDENDLERSAAPPTPKPLSADPVVSFSGPALDHKSANVVFLIGEAGEWVARGVDVSGTQATSITVNGNQAGSIHQSISSDAVLVFLSPSLPLASLYPLSSTLISTLSPKSSTILSSYHLPSYIPTPSSSASLLYLRSAAFPTLSKLESSSVLQPFSPPNLLHGLASSLLMLASLKSPSTLILLPTITPPQPLNGPFTLSSFSSNTSYDVGGPTGLSNPTSVFEDVKGKLSKAAKELGWTWWNPKGSAGKGFEWLDQQRKAKRKNDVGSMYM